MNETGFLILGGTGIAAVSSIANGHAPRAQLFLGAAIAGATLLTIGQSRPELAQAFALVFFLTSLLTNGAGLARAVANALGGTVSQ